MQRGTNGAESRSSRREPTRVAGVGEDRRVEGQFALDPPRVRVDQQLRRVVPRALGRAVGTVGPQPVALAGGDPGHVAVPDRAGAFLQRDAGLAADGRCVAVEQAEVHRRRRVAPHRDVHPGAVPADAERFRQARPGLPVAEVPPGCARSGGSTARSRRSGPGAAPCGRRRSGRSAGGRAGPGAVARRGNRSASDCPGARRTAGHGGRYGAVRGSPRRVRSSSAWTTSASRRVAANSSGWLIIQPCRPRTTSGPNWPVDLRQPAGRDQPVPVAPDEQRGQSGVDHLGHLVGEVGGERDEAGAGQLERVPGQVRHQVPQHPAEQAPGACGSAATRAGRARSSRRRPTAASSPGAARCGPERRRPG